MFWEKSISKWKLQLYFCQNWFVCYFFSRELKDLIFLALLKIIQKWEWQFFFLDKLIFLRQLKDCVVSVVEQLKVELVHRPRQSDQPRGGQVRQKLEDELIWISRRRTRFIPLNLEELSLLIFNHFVNPTLSVILCGWCKST